MLSERAIATRECREERTPLQPDKGPGHSILPAQCLGYMGKFFLIRPQGELGESLLRERPWTWPFLVTESLSV